MSLITRPLLRIFKGDLILYSLLCFLGKRLVLEQQALRIRVKPFPFQAHLIFRAA